MANSERKPPRCRKTCGTVAGYSAHSKAGEVACDACKKARAEYSKLQREKKKQQEKDVAPNLGAKRSCGLHLVDEVSAEEATSAPVEVPDTVNEGPGWSEDRRLWGLREGGRALWDALNATYSLSPVTEVIALEACRMKDRLDRMHAALTNKSTLWFELGEPKEIADEPDRVMIVVNGMISEARQLQAGLGVALQKIGALQAAEMKASKSEDPLEMIMRERQKRLQGK